MMTALADVPTDPLQGMLGRWQLTMETPAGERKPLLTLKLLGNHSIGGTLESPGRETAKVYDVQTSGGRVTFKADGRLLFPVTFVFDVLRTGDSLEGTAKLSILPASKVTGLRVPVTGNP